MPLMKVQVSDLPPNNQQKKKQSPLEELFIPLIRLTKSCGIYSLGICMFRKGNLRRTNCVNALHLIYCVTLMTFMWFNYVRHIYEVSQVFTKGLTPKLSNMLITNIVALGFSLQGTLSLWNLSSQLQTTVVELLDYERDYKLTFNGVQLKQKMFKVNVGSSLALSLVLVIAPLVLLSTGNDWQMVRNYYTSWGILGVTATDEGKALMYISFGIHMLLLLCILIATWNVHLVMVYILWKEFDGIGLSLIEDFKDQNTEETIRQRRAKFERLVILLHQYNSCAHHWPAITMSIAMFVQCFLLYVMIKVQKVTTEDIIAGTLMMLFVTTNLVLIMGTGIIINKKAHAPLETLYRLNLQNLSERAMIEVSIFINRLSGQPLGISVYGFFVIEKSTVLMLFGTILTYFVVMIQMQPSGTEKCDLQTVIDLLNKTKS